MTSPKILCPNGHRHGVPEALADCWLGDDEVREVRVTRREYDVATELLRNGAANRDIGKKLSMSEDTVKTHMKNILRRTGAHTRTDLVVAVFRGRVRLIPVEIAASVFWGATSQPVVT